MATLVELKVLSDLFIPPVPSRIDKGNAKPVTYHHSIQYRGKVGPPETRLPKLRCKASKGRRRFDSSKGLPGSLPSIPESPSMNITSLHFIYRGEHQPPPSLHERQFQSPVATERGVSSGCDVTPRGSHSLTFFIPRFVSHILHDLIGCWVFTCQVPKNIFDKVM